jgi:hypothetical protein
MAFDFQINVRKIQFTEKENFVHFRNKIGLWSILRTQVLPLVKAIAMTETVVVTLIRGNISGISLLPCAKIA